MHLFVGWLGDHSVFLSSVHRVSHNGTTNIRENAGAMLGLVRDNAGHCVICWYALGQLQVTLNTALQ